MPLWALLVRRAGRHIGPARAEVGGALALLAVGLACLVCVSYGTIPVPLAVLFPNLPTLGCGMLLAIVAAARPRSPRLDRAARLVPPAIVCRPLAFLALLRMPGRPTTWPAPDGQWFVGPTSPRACSASCRPCRPCRSWSGPPGWSAGCCGGAR